MGFSVPEVPVGSGLRQSFLFYADIEILMLLPDIGEFVSVYLRAKSAWRPQTADPDRRRSGLILRVGASKVSIKVLAIIPHMGCPDIREKWVSIYVQIYYEYFVSANECDSGKDAGSYGLPPHGHSTKLAKEKRCVEYPCIDTPLCDNAGEGRD